MVMMNDVMTNNYLGDIESRTLIDSAVCPSPDSGEHICHVRESALLATRVDSYSTPS